MATKDKPNNKNLRALFSVICLCIVALGLIVYFSTNSAHTTDVNEATTVVDKAKDKEKKITTQPSTALTTQENTQVQKTKKSRFVSRLRTLDVIRKTNGSFCLFYDSQGRPLLSILRSRSIRSFTASFAGFPSKST